MVDEEMIWRVFADNNIYTSTLAKVTEIKKRRVQIELISATADDLKVPLISVPVGRLCGTSQNIKIGQVIPVFFSKWSLNDIAQQVKTGDCLQELQFNRDNAYALPIIFDDKLDQDFPDQLEIHEKTIFNNDVIFNKTVSIDDTLKVIGAVDFEDTLSVKKLIKSLEDVKAVAVSLLKHQHIGYAGVTTSSPI